MKPTVPAAPATAPAARLRGTVPLVALMAATAAVLGLLALSRGHPGYGTETDFLGAFVPEARRLLSGVPLKILFHPPGYSVILAAAYALVGDWFASGLLLSVLAGVVSVGASYLLFRRIGGLWAAVGSATALLSSPFFLAYGATASSDMVFLALTSLVLLGVAWSWNSGDARRWGATGILVGVTALTRTNGVMLIALAAAPLLQARGRRRTGAAGALLAGALLAPAIWWVVARLMGSPFMPGATYANLAMTYFGPGDRIAVESLQAMQQRFDGLWDVLTFAPLSMFEQYVRDAMDLMRHVFLDGDLLLFPFALLALPGLVLLPLRTGRTRLLVALAAVTLLQIALVNLKTYESRYYLFLVPWLGAAAGLAAAELWASLPRGRARAAAAALAVILVVVGLDDGVWRARQRLHRDESEIAASVRAARAHVEPTDLLVSRKPHLHHYTGAEFSLPPMAATLPELRAWLMEVDRPERETFLFFGEMERWYRPELAFLSDPESAPAWLEALATGERWALYRFRPEVSEGP